MRKGTRMTKELGAVCANCRRGWFALGLVLLAAVPVLAQLPTGTILGTIKDPSGAVIANATVTAQNPATGTARSISTDETGSYRLAALPVGTYDLRVEASGFKVTTQKGTALSVSQEAVLNFALEVGSTTEQVVVTGEA